MTHLGRRTLKSSRRWNKWRRVIPIVAVLVAYALGILGVVAWRIASRPPGDTQTAVAQVNVLLGVFQAFIGFALALTTIYYALRTGELVEAAHQERSDKARRQLDDAVGQLVGSARAAMTAAGAMSPLMKGTWRWALPGRAPTRERFLLLYLPQVTTQLSEAARWAEHVKFLAPELGDQSDAVLAIALGAHEASMAGALDTAYATDLRSAIDLLREDSRRVASGT
jgi:hypothetical protein